MSELDQAPETMLKFSGTPLDVGTQIWTRMCLPAVRKVSTDRPSNELIQLYAGFMMAAMGSLAADFGHEVAHQLTSDLVSTFGDADLDNSARPQ